jgi:uncharacterized oxidoreductase
MNGSRTPPGDRRFDAGRLARAIGAIIAAGGSTDAEARHVAASLVESNLQGHDSHGIGMVPRYVAAVLAGGLVANRQPRITADLGALLAVDGQRGYGQVIGDAAMRLAIARARELGSCVLALANTHHLGRIGQFAQLAVAEGLVSLHFVNVLSQPKVAAWGGTDARFGTNPCCIGIPLPGEPPLILDFATSVVAQGKLRVAHNKGEPVTPGLVLDDDGRPTTDPRYAVVAPFGAILPFGGHKGYGLALACELLGGALTGGATEQGVAPSGRAVVNGMFAVVVDPARLGTGNAFARDSAAFLAWLRDSRLAAGVDRVRIPGEPERESRARRMAEGVPVDDATWREIVAAAARVGVPADAVEALAGDAPEAGNAPAPVK